MKLACGEASWLPHFALICGSFNDTQQITTAQRIGNAVAYFKFLFQPYAEGLRNTRIVLCRPIFESETSGVEVRIVGARLTSLRDLCALRVQSGSACLAPFGAHTLQLGVTSKINMNSLLIDNMRSIVCYVSRFRMICTNQPWLTLTLSVLTNGDAAQLARSTWQHSLKRSLIPIKHRQLTIACPNSLTDKVNKWTNGP